MSEITHILQAIDHGDARAGDELLRLVYHELRQLAARKMAREAPGQTLQPTALVHEAWLRLSGAEQHTWQNRAHFFAAAAEAMRRILIDHARRKKAARHGGGLQRVNIDESGLELAVSAGKDDELLAVHEALDRLASHDKVKAEYLIDVAFGDGAFVAVGGQTGNILTSTNGSDWTRRKSGTDNGLSNITFGNHTFLAAGLFGTILQSDSLLGPPITLALGAPAAPFIPELTIGGPAGRMLEIGFREDLSAGMDWTPLTNLTLTAGPLIWHDNTAGESKQRFYRATLLP